MNGDASNNRSWIIGCAIGLLTAISLYESMYIALSIATGIYEKKMGYPIVYGCSPLWFLFWFALLITMIWKGKPRMVEWIVPFTVILGFAFLDAAASGFHPDTPDQSEIAVFSLVLYLACLCIWGVTLLLGFVRWFLIRLGIEK
jgi:hypothetical protein